MEKCVLCSRNVSLEDPDSFPSVDGIVPKAEVTARFIKTFNRVCRLVNEAGAADESSKSTIFETKNGSISKLPTLCQECADKVQTVDTLTNLLKMQVLEIRKLLEKTQTQKNSEVVKSAMLLPEGMHVNCSNQKIKYSREFLLRMGNKKQEYFNVLERGLPDLVKVMKTFGEKPKINTKSISALIPNKLDSQAHTSNLNVDKVGFPKRRIQYERETLLRIGNQAFGRTRLFDALAHGFPDLVRSCHLSNVQQNKTPTESSIEKLRELLDNPKLTPKNFNTVATHAMDIPISSVHLGIPMLLEKAIEMPEFSKKVTTLLHFMLEKCEPDNQAMYRKLINAQCKLELQRKFLDNPHVIQVKEQLNKENDDNLCDSLEMDLERLKYRHKRRSLNAISLMGSFYKEKLIGAETVVEVVNKFVIAPEDEKLECVCLLLSMVGEYLGGDSSVKTKWLESQLSHLRQRAEGKKVCVKVRDLILNLWKLFKNKWKWEGLSETDNATAMIFQKYSASATKSFEGTINSSLFNFYFPGTQVGVFIENLSKLVATKPNIGKVEDAGKLVRLLIANRNITKLETLFEISLAIKYIGQDDTDVSKSATQLAQFLVEIFSEEGNLDWLIISGKYISQENPPFWERLVTESFEWLAFQTNENFVRTALNRTTQKAKLLKLFEVWEEKRIKICSKQIEDSLRQKLAKGASLNELQRILQKNSWHPTQKITGRALTEAICTLSWNPTLKNWNDQKLNFLLPLLELPNTKMFPQVWRQVQTFCQRVGTENRPSVWTAIYTLQSTST